MSSGVFLPAGRCNCPQGDFTEPTKGFNRFIGIYGKGMVLQRILLALVDKRILLLPA